MSKKSGDISNWVLAILLLAAIVISLGGTIAMLLKSQSELTGLSTDTEAGTARIVITGAAALVVINNSILFGDGGVYANSTSCTIDSGVDSNGNACPLNGTWVAIVDGNFSEFVIRNTGNTDIQVKMAAGNDANAFIGGTNPAYNYQSHDDENEGGCQNATVTSWTTVNTAGSGDIVCGNLTYGAGHRQMEVDLQLTIPQDAPPGDKSDVVTFTGIAIS